MPPHLHALRGLIFGAFFEWLGWFVRMHSGTRILTVSGTVVLILGAVVFTLGCMVLAPLRGHSKWLGLLGLFSLPGLAILWYLPAGKEPTTPPAGL